MDVYLYVIYLILAAAISGGIAVLIRFRPARNTNIFSLLMSALTLWSVGYAMELWATDASVKFFWAGIQYFGIASIPTLWFFFTLQYIDQEKWIPGRLWLLFTIEPIITIILFWTTKIHGLVWSGIGEVTSGKMVFLDYSYGPWFWVHTVYSYILLFGGTFLLLRQIRWAKNLYRSQMVALLIAAIVPWIANFLTLAGLSPIPNIDLTPFGMTISGLAIVWALFGYRFLQIESIARSSVIENLKDGVIVLDTQWYITDINPAAQNLLDIGENCVGQLLSTFIPHQIRLVDDDNYNTQPHQEIIVYPKGGDPRVIDLRSSPLHDHQRNLRGWSLILRDVTEQKKMETNLSQYTAKLENQYRRQAALASLELAINQPHELQAVLDRIVKATVELLPASGGSSISIWDEEKGKFVNSVTTLPENSLKRIASRAQKEGGATHWILNRRRPVVVEDVSRDPFQEEKLLSEIGIRSYVGIPLLAESKAIGVLYANRKKPQKFSRDELNFLSALANRAATAIQKVRLFSRIQHQAITDDLTKIYNRRHLFFLGEREFNRSCRYNRPLSAIMLDIDHFKQVNDTYGHTAGDQVLRNIAKFLKKYLRKFDLIGRYGGEEFIILLPEANLAVAQKVAQRLWEGAQEKPIVDDPVPIMITVSLGIAEISSETPSFQSLVEKADMALYDAKRAGRNRIAWR